jgi:hypothetical protein
MSSITISDLAHSTQLDSQEMSAVRGGTFYFPSFLSSTDFAFSTQQMVGQTQNVSNANGNNAAFVTGIDSKVKPVQAAQNTNTINVFPGALVA